MLCASFRADLTGVAFGFLADLGVLSRWLELSLCFGGVQGNSGSTFFFSAADKLLY